MPSAPTILTNMAFAQSPLWTQSTTSICRDGETPDELGSMRQALRLLRARRRYDIVVTMGARPSLVYGLLCGAMGLASKQVMTEVFLDAPRPRSPAWQIKTALFRWISHRSLGILTNSSAEVGLIAKRFRIPETKLRFVPMYTTVESPGLRTGNDGTVVSIGRTARDLDTLFEAARRIDAPFVVVAGRDDTMPTPVPPNVTLHRELSLAQTRELMASAAVVAIPLLPSDRSTGQVVMFEAMAMGKPIVATRAVGTSDYLRHGENALLVPKKNSAKLAVAIEHLLREPDLALRLASAALDDCLTRYAPDAHAQRKLAAIAELAKLSA
jgi:glycosyltransferase involved in cell wall biosynthesis